MKLQRRHFALVLCACLALAAACKDPSSTTTITSSLLQGDSDNLGDARVWRPLRQSYDGIEGTSGVVSVVEGVGILNDLAVEGGPSTTRMYFVGRRETDTDELFVTDTMAVLDDTDGAARIGDNITYRNTDYVAPLPGQPALDLQTLVYATSQSSPVVAGYEYVRIWDWNAIDESGASWRATNVLGVSTAPGDMPDTGGFDYDLGGFSLALHRVGGSTAFRRAAASAFVDFETGTVDLFLTHQDANIDSIEVTGMQIEGNAFSGGVVEMIDGGVDVTAARTGGVNGVDAAGLFFGPVVDGAPMEVGGEITLQGVSTSYHIFFLAE